MSRDEKNEIIPDQIYDSNTKMMYRKGRFFGKVSAARSLLLAQTR